MITPGESSKPVALTKETGSAAASQPNAGDPSELQALAADSPAASPEPKPTETAEAFSDSEKQARGIQPNNYLIN